MIHDHVVREGFEAPLALVCANLLDSISNMSLIATSLTKSSVLGAIPRGVEFTPGLFRNGLCERG